MARSPITTSMEVALLKVGQEDSNRIEMTESDLDRVKEMLDRVKEMINDRHFKYLEDQDQLRDPFFIKQEIIRQIHEGGKLKDLHDFLLSVNIDNRGCWRNNGTSSDKKGWRAYCPRQGLAKSANAIGTQRARTSNRCNCNASFILHPNHGLQFYKKHCDACKEVENVEKETNYVLKNIGSGPISACVDQLCSSWQMVYWKIQ